MSNFKKWLESKDGFSIKEVADKWYRHDGSPRTRTMTQHMIFDTMQTYNIGLEEAASLVEKAMLYYKPEHVVGGPKAYWNLVERLKKSFVGFSPEGYPVLKSFNIY
jgi:hypothetical protein